MIPVHSEVIDLEFTPDPKGDGGNLLITAHGGLKIEFGFSLALALKLRDQVQQGVALCGEIRGHCSVQKHSQKAISGT